MPTRVSYDSQPTGARKKRKVRRYKQPIGPPAPGKRAPGPFPRSPSTTVPKPPGPISGHEHKKIRRFKKTKKYKRAYKAAQKSRVRAERKRVKRTAGRLRGQQAIKFLKAAHKDDHGLVHDVISTATAPARFAISQGKKELEGKGVLAAGTKETKKALEKAPIVSSVPVSPLAASQTAPHAAKIGDNKVFANFLKDVIDLPAQVPASTYQTAAAAFEAAKGDPARAKKLWGELKNHDAVALAVQGRWDEAIKSAEDHPGILALELWGGKGLVGRLAGAARRGTAVTKTLPGTKVEERLPREKDAIRGARKTSQANRARKKVVKKRAEADQHEKLGNQTYAKQLRDEAARKDPDLVKESDIRRRVAERVQANEDIRRIHRTRIHKRADAATERGAHGAQSLVAQGITKPDRADLAAYATELKDEYKNLTPAGKLANESLRNEIQKALDNPKLDLAKVQRKADAYRDLLEPLKKELDKAGILPKAQADRAELVPYAVRNMGAKHDGAKLTLNGRKLSDREIAAHMKQNGVKPPAFITQAPNMRGGKNFYQGSGERPKGMASRPRTGEATKKGTFDAHPDTLVEGAARLQGLVDTNEGFRGFVKEFGRREGTKVKTYKNRKLAQDKVNQLEAEGGGPGWRVIRLNPWGGKQDQLRALLEDVDAENQASHQPLIDALQDAVEGKDGSGPWALVPNAAADELLKFLRTGGSGGVGKSFQLVNSAFRKTVLSTSSRWATGNVVEGGGRTGLMGAGPRSYLTARKYLKELERIDPAAHEEVMVRGMGGGHFSMAVRAHVHRAAEQFYGTKLEPLARVLGRVWRTPGPKQVAQGWRVYTDFVFGSMRKLESQFQTAMFGKALRDDLIRTGEQAIEAARKQRGDINAYVAYGRVVDRAYGRYSKWSPAERHAIALYTPFMAWTINSLYFLTRTLPADHPVLTGLLAAQHVMTEEWREDNALGKFLDNGVPNWLQGAVPTDDGWLRLRYTPFAIASDPLGSAAGAVLPQYRGIQMAFQGMDWKGQKLYKDGREYNDLELITYGIGEFLKGTVPISRQVESVATGEGPLFTRLRKEFNPFEPVPKTAASGSEEKGGPLGSSSSSSSSSSGGGPLGSSSSSSSSSGGPLGSSK